MTCVEHQALCSVKWAMSQMHLWCVSPLNLKGKMQGLLGAAPLSVVHTFLGFFISAKRITITFTVYGEEKSHEKAIKAINLHQTVAVGCLTL